MKTAWLSLFAFMTVSSRLLLGKTYTTSTRHLSLRNQSLDYPMWSLTMVRIRDDLSCSLVCISSGSRLTLRVHSSPCHVCAGTTRLHGLDARAENSLKADRHATMQPYENVY